MSPPCIKILANRSVKREGEVRALALLSESEEEPETAEKL